jgi:hypothetical protein
MKKQEYEAYYAMQDQRTKYLQSRSECKHRGDHETASEFGEKAVVVNVCMSILVKYCKLTFAD